MSEAHFRVTAMAEAVELANTLQAGDWVIPTSFDLGSFVFDLNP